MALKNSKQKRKYWLMKSEPEVFSIDNLRKDRTTYWDGVRNYQARNFLRDEVREGDGVLFYHSNAEPSGIAGLAEVVRAGYPDPSQFDSKDVHFDPKSKKENPAWYAVDIRFVKKFPRLLSLEDLRKVPALSKMALLKRGQRLSVQPVSENEWETVLLLAQ